MMPRALIAVLAAVALGIALAACSSSSSTGPVAQSVGTAAALKDVQQLERESAAPHVHGFEVTRARLATSVSQTSDSFGHVLTVSPSVSRAWLVELLAPAQLTWAGTPAIAIVDASNGQVRASGLWKRPLDAPVKPWRRGTSPRRIAVPLRRPGFLSRADFLGGGRVAFEDAEYVALSVLAVREVALPGHGGLLH